MTFFVLRALMLQGRINQSFLNQNFPICIKAGKARRCDKALNQPVFSRKQGPASSFERAFASGFVLEIGLGIVPWVTNKPVTVQQSLPFTQVWLQSTHAIQPDIPLVLEHLQSLAGQAGPDTMAQCCWGGP